MQSDLAWMTIEEVAPLVATRAVSPRDLLESVFRRIEQYNSALNAYMTLDLERARADAQRAEAESCATTTEALCTGFRSRSRTTSGQPACAPRLARKFWPTSYRRKTQPSFAGCGAPAP